ncbi:MAG: hypothetical protein KJ989_14555 [Gammaproteobacteria bacterium]|nr:hypothetical protein [Gammaproteobacteria bacterium]MBU2158415.1 hypothetical protein [Gammaproteobacteria bacterium]MBU2257039.1 hypothetical protein [Gammaproteobacteria bacterium]MBU2295419.1 hypothetical protein [Gammaproteobacteria bacterium]
MKKQIIATCVALGLGVLAGTAFAAPTAFENNQKVTGGVGNNCPLLSRDVTLGVSAKVHGAYECDEAANLVKVAACHQGGSRSGVTCVAIQVLDAAGAPVAGSFTYPAGCDATSAAAGTQSPIPSYKSFFTSSAGGVMIEYPLDGRCAAGTLTGIEGF